MDPTLGELELLVLLALARLGDDAYGVRVFEEIQRRTGREPALGTIYKALIRLEAKGYLASRLGEPTPVRGGRRKRCYRLLAPGRRALLAEVGAIWRLAHGLEGLGEARP